MQANNISGLPFSERLRALMKERKITQLILSQRVGVSQGAVSGWLNGALPKMDKLVTIAQVLGVAVEDLINVEGLRDAIQSADKFAARVAETPEQQDAVFNRLVSGARGALKTAREKAGFTPAELAKRVGYSLSVYQNIEDGLSRIGEKQAKKLAAVLGIDVSLLMSGSDHPPEEGAVFGSFGTIPELRLPAGMTAKRVPLLAMAECGSMAWDDGAYTGEGVTVIDCEDPRAFAVKLSGDSMQPKYDPGDVAIVYPSFSARNGDLVIARLDESHGADVMFKICQFSADQVILGSYNSAYDSVTYPRSAFQWIYVVDQVIKKVRNSRR